MHRERDAACCRELDTTFAGIVIDRVDMIWRNCDRRIARFEAMVRPLKAIGLPHQRKGRARERRRSAPV